MRVDVKGTARVRAMTSGNELTIEADELDFDTHSRERGMGEETVYGAKVDFEDGSISWELTEYPVGVLNFQNTHTDKLKLLRDFQITLLHDAE